MDEPTDIAVLMQQRAIADSRVTTRVGDRFRPQVLRQGDVGDGVTYRITQADSWGNLEGTPSEAQTRVQVECSAASYLASVRLSELLKDLFNGFSGTLGVDEQVTVHDCTLDNEWDMVEPVVPGSDERSYVRKSDYIVTHTVPVPSHVVATPEVEE